MADQNHNYIFEISNDEPNNLLREIDAVLGESGRLNAEIRWKTKVNYIMSAIGSSVAHFYITRTMSKNITDILFSIHKIFRRSNIIDKIRKDNEMQNIFLLGYLHAINEVCMKIKNYEDTKKDTALASIVKSNKHTAAILLALDDNIELSHNELANMIGISKNSLSNYMSKTKYYSFFNSNRIGKFRYYTIAKPYGVNALEIVKRSKDYYKI
jgi:hypothetical protein